ncbi:putative oxalocrotonate tautomerase [Pyrenochaeta sp. MPI-SDFR-AT-0127]|nr:putative oxalocrotonate tautomerase [Pyrenochaeta sp. MPI-SDFR-AT-0127]
MPLWLIFHPEGTFEELASKRDLTQDITKIYTDIGLPSFYVVVNFIKTSAGDTWVGGEHVTKKPFIRLVAEHIAVNMPNNDEAYKRVTTRIDQALKPHIADKGYNWEFHVDETERRLWKVNGMIPPAFGSEEEKLWVKENRAVSFPGAY